MKLVPYDVRKVNRINTNSDNYAPLAEFADSGLECAKVEGWPHKTATACAVSLRASIKHYRMFTIRVFVRKGEVFLIKNEELYGK